MAFSLSAEELSRERIESGQRLRRRRVCPSLSFADSRAQSCASKTSGEQRQGWRQATVRRIRRSPKQATCFHARGTCLLPAAALLGQLSCATPREVRAAVAHHLDDASRHLRCRIADSPSTYPSLDAAASDCGSLKTTRCQTCAGRLGISQRTLASRALPQVAATAVGFRHRQPWQLPRPPSGRTPGPRASPSRGRANGSPRATAHDCRVESQRVR